MGKATAFAFCLAIIYLQDGVIRFVESREISRYAPIPEPGTAPNLFEGDMALSGDQGAIRKKAIETKQSLQEVAQETFGASSTAFQRWTKGVVPYTIHSSLARNTRALQAIKAAMREWESKTCIRFKRRYNQKNYLEFFRNNGCWGHVGMGNGKTQISVGNGCEYRHVMTHEIGHSIGFWHEQSRTDRDSWIQILWANVPAAYKEAFAKYGRDKLDSLGVPYDYGSIMHYPWNAFSTNGRNTVRPLRSVPRQPYRVLSDSDAEQTKRMYKSQCGGTNPPKPTRKPRPPPKPRTGRPPPRPNTDKRPVTECEIVTVVETVYIGNTYRYRANCRDTNRYCRSWASKGECRRNPGYMRTSCCRSCSGGGGGGGSCRDKNRSCRSWASRGECRRNPAYMLQSCRKSCRACRTGKKTKKVKKCYTVAPPQTTKVVPMTPPIIPMTPPIPTTPTRPPFTGKPPPLTALPSGCTTPAAAGLEDLSIPDSSLTASSSLDSDHGPKHGRLNLKQKSWCSKENNRDQFLQIDLGKPSLVKKVATQGGSDSKYVTKYFISYSEDGKTWNQFVSPNQFWATKEFTANSDKDTVVDNEFFPPIVARYFKIHPAEWKNQICLRAELFICKGGKKVPPTPPISKKKVTPPIKKKKVTPPIHKKKVTPPIKKKKVTPPIPKKKVTPPIPKKKVTPPIDKKTGRPPIDKKTGGPPPMPKSAKPPPMPKSAKPPPMPKSPKPPPMPKSPKPPPLPEDPSSFMG